MDQLQIKEEWRFAYIKTGALSVDWRILAGVLLRLMWHAIALDLIVRHKVSFLICIKPKEPNWPGS